MITDPEVKAAIESARKRGLLRQREQKILHHPTARIIERKAPNSNGYHYAVIGADLEVEDGSCFQIMTRSGQGHRQGDIVG